MQDIKKIIKQAKGYYGRRKNCYKTAKDAVEKALQYQYRDRKNKKRTFRSLWIQRINAGVRLYSEKLTYGTFIHALTKINIEIDRKVLSGLAISNPDHFKSLVEKAEASLG